MAHDVVYRSATYDGFVCDVTDGLLHAKWQHLSSVFAFLFFFSPVLDKLDHKSTGKVPA